MDSNTILYMANQVTSIKMYPYLEAGHCVISCLQARADLGQDSLAFSRKHPLACWTSCMVSIFSGTLLASFLLGEPLLEPLKNTESLLLATIIWYLIFYSPLDLAYLSSKTLPCRLIFVTLKEIGRCRKVLDGVNAASRVYPQSYLVMALIGMIRGNGSAFMKPIVRILRGAWTPSVIELLAPSFSSKASLLAALVFVVDKKTNWLNVPHSLIYFGVIVFFTYFKLSSIILGIHDPFVPFENLCCLVFFGGLRDAFSRILTDRKSVPSGAAKCKSSNHETHDENSADDDKDDNSKHTTKKQK